MKAKKIGYWVCTALVAAAMLSGGINQILRPPVAVQGFTQLGYPVYFMVLLGVWKALGGATILAPRFPLLKEWAYAGIFFDLTGAAVSNAAVGGGAGHILAPLILAGLTVASWALRPQSRRLTAK